MHACQTRIGSYQNTLVELIRVGGEDSDGNPCDRSQVWTLIPGHGSFAATSLISPVLMSIRLCLEDDSAVPELDCLSLPSSPLSSVHPSLNRTF